MVKLNKVIAKSRTTEIDGVSIQIIAEYDKGDWSSDAHLTTVFTQFKAEAARLNTAINRIKAESELEAKDEIRDEKIRAINYLILGALHHPEDDIRTAAEKINKVFSNYGVEIVLESYTVETSLVESLLKEFANAELLPSIEKISVLTKVIEDLKTAQDAFIEVRLIYDKEKGEESEEKSATKIKKEVVTIINNKLIVYLRAMIQVDETKYGEFTRTIAEIIDNNNEVVKKRDRKPEPVSAEE